MVEIKKLNMETQKLVYLLWVIGILSLIYAIIIFRKVYLYNKITRKAVEDDMVANQELVELLNKNKDTFYSKESLILIAQAESRLEAFEKEKPERIKRFKEKKKKEKEEFKSLLKKNTEYNISKAQQNTGFDPFLIVAYERASHVEIQESMEKTFYELGEMLDRSTFEIGLMVERSKLSNDLHGKKLRFLTSEAKSSNELNECLNKMLKASINLFRISQQKPENFFVRLFYNDYYKWSLVRLSAVARVFKNLGFDDQAEQVMSMMPK